MKKIFFLFILATLASNAIAQDESYEFATYTPPKGSVKKTSETSIQFTKEDAANGSFCIITLLKSLPGTANSKENFDLAWTTLIKEMVTVTTAPEMQAPATENGWEAQSGFAPFESDGLKGVAILVTSTGFEKMVNIIILTNSDTYEKDISDFLGSISLRKPESKSQQVNEKPQVRPAATGFIFNTTNFDDGWTSTVQEDWVQASKGSIRVLIHYPNKQADAYNSVLLDGLKNAWNILVAPKYSTASNFEFKPISSWEPIEFAEADAVEKSTGKKVHVVLFRKNHTSGNGRYLEFITPDKRSFEQEFGAYHETTYGWEKLENMANYNKFAIAASDLEGKWTSDFSGAIQYVNASTGFDAGMDTHASLENFLMGPGTSYKWDISVASGAVGNIKFQSVKSSGKFSMTGNWQVNFSDIEGKQRSYNAFFSCIRGLRILWLDGKGFAKAQ